MKRTIETNTAKTGPSISLDTRGRNFLAHHFVGLLLIWVALLPGPAFAAHPKASFKSDRILIKPKEKNPPGALNNLHKHLGNHVLRTFPRIANWQVVDIPSHAAAHMIAAYESSGLVARAEPDYIVHPSFMPNDYHFLNGDQWNLLNLGQYGGTPGADIDATNAWDFRTSASNVIVAVVDTGIRYTHEDLAANMWQNPQANLDGYTNDFYGINLVTNGRGSGDPWDDHGHGTHVAGILGAVGNNGVGIAGICWQVQLMALKFIDTNGNGTISDAITCLDYAASHGANIVTASWGSYAFASAALWDTMNMLRDHDIIVVAAAGNSANNNDTNPLYPASYSTSLDNVIAVAATGRSDQLAPWSDYGQSTVQIAAPGDAVFSCWNGSDSDYQYYQGTSMAVPHVAGACALVWAEHTNLTAVQVIHQVLTGVDVLTNLVGVVGTGGRLNLYNALSVAAVPPPPPPATNVWVDDSLPAGAESTPVLVTNFDANGNVEWYDEPWVWITNQVWITNNPTPPSGAAAVGSFNPAPFSGVADVQMESLPGIHQLQFSYASDGLTVYQGDTLFVYVYLDPADPPDEVMVEWSDGSWEHRAFWGANIIEWGQYGTSDRLDMGALPPAGQWVRLAVPASELKLEGTTLQGLSLMLYNGRAAWDYAGRDSLQLYSGRRPSPRHYVGNPFDQ